MSGDPERDDALEEKEQRLLESLAGAAFSAYGGTSADPEDPATGANDEGHMETFLKRYWEDQDAQGVRPLEEYLAMFPGHARSIAREYLALEESRESPSAPSAFLDAGDRLGPYEVVRELGRGGQGVVYLAEDIRLHRKVALKLLTNIGPGSEETVVRFRREAEVASKLEHPGICGVHDAGVANSVPYIAMQYVEGKSLAERIAESKKEAVAGKPSSLVVFSEATEAAPEPDTRVEPTSRTTSSITKREMQDILHLIEGAARALHEAHEAGIIHRDVKPGNIMVTADGDPVILDFGLARADDMDLQTLTRTGDFFGTPAYMSPEQLTVQRLRLDRRTDVYSLGVVLFECLTLKRPFEAPTREGLYQAILSKDPPDLRKLNPDVPTDLRVICETALEKDRDRRYQTTKDLAEDLRRFRQFEPIHAKPITCWIKLKRWAQRHPGVAASLSLALLLLMGAVLALFGMLQSEKGKLTAETKLTGSLKREADSFAKYVQTSDPALLRYLMSQADELWPRREEKVAEMEAWLGQARELRDRIERRMADLALLRVGARKPTDQDRAKEDRLRRERYPELFEKLALAERAASDLKQQLAKATREQGRGQIEESLVDAEDALASLQEDRRLAEQQVWGFDDPEDEQIHRALSELERGREAFQGLIADVEQRVKFAQKIRERSLAGHQEAWDVCGRDLAGSERYRNLKMSPQVGLVPLGKGADSGFWEFWHIGSGERPVWEGAPLSGKAKIDERSGIVLVLLPGGTFWMGAQKEDSSKPNFDLQARAEEGPVNEITLAHFFMGKHEVTQGQWARLMQANPSFYLPGQRWAGQTVTLLNPVEQVTWHDAASFLQRVDLLLPTEAQWEYAARGGTEFPWWTGKDKMSLNGKVNLADTAGANAGFTRFEADLTDGHAVHASAGSFPANAFGLHEVLGNVFEWCRDGYGPYTHAVDADNGLRHVLGARMLRGGSFENLADRCSARRYEGKLGLQFMTLGFRAARSIEP